MAIQTEARRTGEFIVSESNGHRSRETVTLTGGDFPAGQVLGVITANGKYTDYDAGAADGTETAAGILYAATDASAADQNAVVIVRDCEVASAALTGSDAAGVADFLAIGVIVR
ncbi:MAG: head decoration protein [Pontibacterium sp.]